MASGAGASRRSVARWLPLSGRRERLEVDDGLASQPDRRRCGARRDPPRGEDGRGPGCESGLRGARVFRAGVPPCARLPDPSGEPEDRGTLGSRRHGGGATHRPCRARGRDRDLPPARVSPGPRARDPGASVAAEGGVVPARHQERRRGRNAGSRGHPRGAESVHDARASATARSHVDGGRVRVRHEGPAQGRSAQAGDPARPLALVLSRGQGRRPRRERGGEVDAAPDHGGRGPRLPRRGVPGRGAPHRLPAAGAPARPAKGRARQHRGGRGRDAESVAWLERFLKEYPGTVVAITHDRYFLDNVAGWILELDRGHGIPWEGNYSSWLEQKHRRLEQEEKADVARRRTLERELEWVRMAPRARQAKGKARLSNYEALLAEASEQRVAALEIAVPPGPRLGDVVVEADHVTKAYGDRVLIDDLSFKLPRGGIVGVVGPNGAGKTTLFRMIVGQEKPDAGTLRVGETVKLAYVDQSRDALDPEKTVWEEISGGADTLALGGRTVPSRAYVASFNFKGSDQQKRVADLSGGERNRLHLATMLKRDANALLLDEPTNDLDVDTLRALEEALLDFAGCAVVISHDRWFLDRIATHILAFEDEGRAVWVEGSYSEYEADRKKRLGADADRPHRLRYKRLRSV